MTDDRRQMTTCYKLVDNDKCSHSHLFRRILESPAAN